MKVDEYECAGTLWICYHALKDSQWENVKGKKHRCPYCANTKSKGHDVNCMIGNGLEWMENLISKVRELQ